ncbi:hypothetical protein CV102_02340 [Natronococcus pandeyae]|uniref:CARDB domain-containing protein n=1 Tax=Natronococcus pandeyae TaxID=2055836 RepID=A0A8J8TSB2_9EURY|nr:hypothetical protein [Natronococcus pandeyae]TYL40433.1 hypothetical protein CV102_02340 [Natronococcus pandeyae]
MRRRRYLAAGGSLAATLTGGVEAIKRGAANRVRDARENDGSVEVRILETNAPVEGGTLLEGTVELENTGTTSARPTVESFVEGDRHTVRRTSVDAGDTETVEFGGYRTYPVEADDRITVRVETEDDADERAVDVLAVDGLDPAQTTPDREVAVLPGTTVLFEVESDALGEYGGRTQWFVDGEYVGWSMGPWYSAYYGHRGADYWRETFESPGTREVTAAIDGDDETSRATWTVEVTEAGTPAPSIDEQRPADESLEVVRGEPTELELDVSHPGGGLERVVWWLGHADVVLETTDVGGTEDTAAIELERYCHGCPIVVWVIGEHGTVASEGPWVIDEVRDEPDPALEVTITETNDPVDAGELLEVTADVENAADAERSGEVDLIVGHDPELVDSQSVTVDAGDTETVDLEFETAMVRRTQTFPARVKTDDDADERTVEVIGTEDVALDVTITETNAPVQTGEFLEVTAEFENGHDSGLQREAQLVVGHDPDVVETTVVSVDAGDTETVTMGYETALVETDQEFPVRVELEGDADEVPVFVYVDEPPLLVSVLETNDPVAAGDLLEVTAELENTADSETTQEIELVVGHDPQLVDARSVTVDGGDTETVSLEFETALVRRTQEFPVRVEGDDDAAVRDVEVIGTDDADVTVAITESNDPVDAGEVLEVIVDVENDGEAAITKDLEFVVGHDPTVVDTASVRVDPGETETVELSFETATVENDQEFPVRVESAVASDERTVLVRGTTEEELEIEFVDCTRAEVAGRFEDGDDLTVETLFVDSAGVGNAHSGITVGDEIDAPFSGTIRLRIAEETRIADRTDDEVLVELATAGFGSTIGSVIVNWFEPDEVRESNPLDCVDERRPDRPTIFLEDVAPVTADSYEVVFGYENPNALELIGGEFVEGTTPDEPPALEPGAHMFTVEWMPETDDERLVWEVDLEHYLYDETLRAETEPASEYPTLEPATFAVTILDAPDSVSVGEVLEVTAELTNVGDESGETIVQLDTDQQQDVDSRSVSLAPDDSEPVTLTYQPTQEDVGERTVTVSTDDDAASVQVTVTDPEPEEPADEPLDEEEPDETPEEPDEDPPADPPEDGPDEDPPDETPEEGPDEDPPEDPAEDAPDEPTDDQPEESPEDAAEQQPDDQPPAEFPEESSEE